MKEEDDRGGQEGEGIDDHKSVILHLIKQVKIGMDLTRGKLLISTLGKGSNKNCRLGRCAFV